MDEVRKDALSKARSTVAPMAPRMAGFRLHFFLIFRSLTYVKLKPRNGKRIVFLLEVKLLFLIFIYFEIKPYSVCKPYSY